MGFLLVATIFLPLLGAVLMWVVAPFGRNVVRWSALAVSVVAAVGACIVAVGYPADGAVGEAGYAAVETVWMPASTGADIRFSVALDGLGLWMFPLSAILIVTSVLVSWKAIDQRAALFYGMLLLLEFGCLGVFAARDLLLFYVFFEFTLIPLFFLIGVWGSEDRRYAAMKFFLYTLAGSLLTFLGLLTIVFWNYYHAGDGVLQFSIAGLEQSLASYPMPLTMQIWVFAALFLGFAIKVPLFPLHTWLPLAHVQAPTAGSIVLAGVMLKIGVYGFLRFNAALLPEATAACAPVMLWLSVAGIIYGALVALAQSDIKRLIAYSSVSHLGFCMLGVFALNPLGVEGGVLQMVNHGISTGALFALVGMLYERYHTREIASYSGMARRLPVLSFFLLFFTFSSIGLPGLNGFAGEFLLLAGMFQRAWADSIPSLAVHLRWISVLAVAGVVLGAWYMLWLVQRVFFGPLKEPHEDGHDEPVEDLCWREIACLAPLAVLALWIGLWPGFFLSRMSPSLRPLADRAGAKLEEMYAPQAMAAAPDADQQQPISPDREER